MSCETCAAEAIQVDPAKPDGGDLAFVAHGDHHGHLVINVDDLIAFGDNSGPNIGTTQVDQGYLVETQAAEVVLDTCPKLLGALCKLHRDFPLRIRISSDFACNNDAIAWPEHLPDYLVDETVAVELSRIDVVDTKINRTLKQRDRRGRIGLAMPELHRAIAHASHIPATQRVSTSGRRNRFRITGH